MAGADLCCLEVLESLRQRLPPRWAVESRSAQAVDILTPERRRFTLRLIATNQLSPNAISKLKARPKEALLVVAPYLSPAVRARLQDAGINYADLTGNTRIAMDRPALFIEQTGADRGPKKAGTSARSLKGDKAGRVVRVLIERGAPPGLRELARLAGVDPGYASRLLAMLAAENLIERGAAERGHGRARSSQGAIRRVDWPALLRRWTVDAPFNARTSFYTYLAPRGINPVLEKLKVANDRYALTGSWVAAKIAPVASSRLTTIYSEDPGKLAAKLDLAPAEAGANVILAWPKSDLPFVGTERREGLICAALAQVAADLLGGPGRSPAEGDALITWMAANEDRWRA